MRWLPSYRDLRPTRRTGPAVAGPYFPQVKVSFVEPDMLLTDNSHSPPVRPTVASMASANNLTSNDVREPREHPMSRRDHQGAWPGYLP